MNKNPNFVYVIKEYKKMLFYVCSFEVIFFAVWSFIVNGGSLIPDFTKIELSQIIINDLPVILFSLIIDSLMLKKISDLKSLMSRTPVKCVVEDFVITGDRVNGSIRYNVSLLLKNPETHELLFSYGRHCLSHYNYTYSSTKQGLEHINIYRKDGSTVKIGDEVYVYIIKFVDVTAVYDEEDETLKLNNKYFGCILTNPNHSGSVFENVRFYKGAVEVDKEYACQ